MSLHENLTAEDVIKILNLKPLPEEGGFYRETARASELIEPHGYAGSRSLSTAIYYLVTHDSFSALHRVPGPEIFHFYLGDAVQMLQIREDGSSKIVVLGPDLRAGMQLQVIVGGNTWQGLRLSDGGSFALLGTTMSPGFDFKDFESGDRKKLSRQFPSLEDTIRHFTR